MSDSPPIENRLPHTRPLLTMIAIAVCLGLVLLLLAAMYLIAGAGGDDDRQRVEQMRGKLRELRQSEAARLEGYGWVNKQEGVVHIPIERAMTLLAEDPKRFPEPPKAAPKDSPKAAPKDSPKAASKDSPKAAPKDSPKAAPKDSPKAAPKDSPKAASKDSPKAAPKEAERKEPTAANKDDSKKDGDEEAATEK
ncbi:hypothetical protein Pan216_17280 [Planctomycetes bacterium Pan216]|uniref:Uncharacterized protein n=1 Tax=Kolteria novifilia TaxID=2527975 RepID=A0A518B1L7_9BACT|nr:hypothetical protein Pan216_17280 [Planctomycetes bacterium Pan216]